MKKIKLSLGILALLIFLAVNFISCKKPSAAPTEDTADQPNLPVTTYTYFAKHGVNDNLATLGRVLFYDKNLSTNNSISCGSCHKQEFAFADNVKFNAGFNGMALKRNSPSIQGVRGLFLSDSYIFQNGTWVPNLNPGMPDEKNEVPALLFWDGRQKSLKDMVLNPVLNHNEMNVPDFTTLITKLSKTPYYTELFKKTFGDENITKQRIAYAIDGFISCLNTNNLMVQPFDNFGTPLPPANLSPLEEQGRQLFHNKYNCAQCHDPSNSGGYNTVTSPSMMFNIGLDEVYTDNGLGKITGKPGDNGVFKVPTLKNISLTAPYMHDGRFSNLGEVIDHYSHNIKPNQNLSGLFRNFDGTPKKLNINAAEKQALIAFLNTLKDEDFLTSPMYSDPFKK